MPIKKEIKPTPTSSVHPTLTTITPAVSVTTRLMNQMKDLSVSATISNVALTSAIQSSASYFDDYEITDTAIQSPKKSNASVAAFPPRHGSTSDRYERDTPTSSISNEGGIRFGTTPAPQSSSATYDKSNVNSLTSFFA